MITEYCSCADNLPMLTTDIVTKLTDLLKVNHSTPYIGLPLGQNYFDLYTNNMSPKTSKIAYKISKSLDFTQDQVSGENFKT